MWRGPPRTGGQRMRRTQAGLKIPPAPNQRTTTWTRGMRRTRRTSAKSPWTRQTCSGIARRAQSAPTQVTRLLALFPSIAHPVARSRTHSLTHARTHSLTHSLKHSRTHALTPSLPHSLPHSLPPSLPHSLTHSRTHARTHSLTHSLTHSRTHSLTHARTHSLTHARTHSLTHSLTAQSGLYTSPDEAGCCDMKHDTGWNRTFCLVGGLLGIWQAGNPAAAL